MLKKMSSHTRLSFAVLLLAAASSCATAAEDGVLSRLGSAPARWVALPQDERVVSAGLPTYVTYDKGSIRRTGEVAYVKAVYGNKKSKGLTHVVAAHCKRHRLLSVASISDSGEVSLSALWNGGKIKFSDPRDGGDYMIWPIPGSDMPDVNELFKAACAQVVASEAR